jgi:hypothetical protein
LVEAAEIRAALKWEENKKISKAQVSKVAKARGGKSVGRDSS